MPPLEALNPEFKLQYHKKNFKSQVNVDRQ
jgi:hypothetical protein